jgi:Baculovirus FP protein
MPNTDGNLCNKCKQKITPRNAPGVQCSGACKKFYHKKCAAIPDEIFNGLKEGHLSWSCFLCKNKRQSVVIADPIQFLFETPGPSSSPSIPNEPSALGSNFEIENINTTLATVQAAQISLQTAISSLSNAVNSFNQKFLEIEKRLTVVEAIKSENSDLKKRVKELELTVDDLEKFKHSKAIEIKGIPALNNEDVSKTVGVVAKSIDCGVQSSDFDNYFRVGRSDTIIVSFTSKLKQREFLFAAKKKKLKLEALRESLGLNEDDRHHDNIFINESVSKKSKLLLKLGRDLKREKKIHWIGTESGNVVCRLSFGGSKHVIKEKADLDKIVEKKSDSDDSED